MRYESTAAPASSAFLSTRLPDSSGRSILVLGLHPHCPCSKATIAELSKILAHTSAKCDLIVYAFKPKEETDAWIESSTISSLKKLNARVEVDADGAKARNLRFNTSGQIQLYSAKGDLLYDGGITSARGHEGDNLGAQTVIALLQKGSLTTKSAPVFGCPIIKPTSP